MLWLCLSLSSQCVSKKTEMSPKTRFASMDEIMYLGNLLRWDVEFSANFAQKGWNQVRPLREDGGSIGFSCLFWTLLEYLAVERDAQRRQPTIMNSFSWFLSKMPMARWAVVEGNRCRRILILDERSLTPWTFRHIFFLWHNDVLSRAGHEHDRKWRAVSPRRPRMTG